MINQKIKRNILPSLQRRIVHCLALKGPQTINEIKKNILLLKLAPHSHYKSTWQAVQWLSKKNLVQKVTVKEYRGRKYPRFWLTDQGIVVALIDGVDSSILLERTREIYPDHGALLYSLEIAPKLNPEVFRIGYSMIKNKGKLELPDLVTILFTQMQAETSTQAFSEVMAILKQYPEQYKSFKAQIEKMSENLDRIKKII